MKPLMATVILLLSWAFAGAQTPNPATKAKPVSPFAEYAGYWTSDFEGHTWLVLRLELQGDQLHGSLIHPQKIDLNDSGELKSVSEEQSTETLIDAVVNPDGLLLTLKDNDTKEPDRYMMRFVTPTKDAADLKMIGMAMPPGMPKPKPWRVVRHNGASPPPTNGPR